MELTQDRIVSHARELLDAKEKRENRRISYRVMAAEAGVSLSTVQEWMNNNVTRFYASPVIAICRYLGCEVGDLLTIETVEMPAAHG